MAVVALMIEWDRTGKRAGGINTREDKGLKGGLTIQNMDVIPHLEIRQVMDDRDIEPYRDVEGITILEGVDAINAAIEEYFPDQARITSETLLIEDMKERGIPLSKLAGMDVAALANYAKENDLAGYTVLKRPRLEDDGKEGVSVVW